MPKTADLSALEPLLFEPIFKERIWGGRLLESLYGKPLPPDARIGESWEIVDRPEAQSVVLNGSWRGRTLHELWSEQREEIFGEMPDSERFPLLIKLLDAQERLSLQVHPPAEIAKQLNGEPKTEFWYFAETRDDAEIFVGLKSNRTKRHIEDALETGRVEDHVHRLRVRRGDAMFLPSGRIHAIGAGNVIVEIQQNSDTTYRVFDWNRVDESGRPRDLHIAQSLRAIDFDDHEPALVKADGESLMRSDYFEVEKWNLASARAVSPPGSFAIVACLTGEAGCAGVTLRPGNFLLVPACLAERQLAPCAEGTTLLRITVPSSR